MKQTLTQFKVKIQCDDSIGFDDLDDLFAKEADILKDIENALYEDQFRKVTFYRNIY